MGFKSGLAILTVGMDPFTATGILKSQRIMSFVFLNYPLNVNIVTLCTS